jgi:hypothetical protein
MNIKKLVYDLLDTAEEFFVPLFFVFIWGVGALLGLGVTILIILALLKYLGIWVI